MRYAFTPKVTKGALDWGSEYNEARWRMFLQDNEGKTLEITKRENKRSLTQNNYYWLYLEIIEQETGNNANDLHELFRRTLLPAKFVTVMGKELRLPRSTTELSKHEFGEYLDRICAECGVPLPDPQEAGYISN